MCLDARNTETLIKEVLQLARQAGSRIVEVYGNEGSDVEVTMKLDQTPVTKADLAAHDIIVQGLSELSPQYPVLSEESDETPFKERNDWDRYWLVDPLDGTREFLRRNGEFSVNIALIEDNKSILGVITAPVLDVAYYAATGFGAFKQQGDETPEPIHVRTAPSRITVAKSRCPTVGPRLQHFLDKLGRYDEIAMGSALKSCLIAEGVADVYARFGPTGEWDTAAAQCIVEEAGGHITDHSREDLRYNMRESLINPHFVVFGDDRIDWTEHLHPEPQG